MKRESGSDHWVPRAHQSAPDPTDAAREIHRRGLYFFGGVGLLVFLLVASGVAGEISEANIDRHRYPAHQFPVDDRVPPAA